MIAHCIVAAPACYFYRIDTLETFSVALKALPHYLPTCPLSFHERMKPRTCSFANISPKTGISPSRNE